VKPSHLPRSIMTLCCTTGLMLQAVPSAMTMPNLVTPINRSNASQAVDFQRHFRELGVQGAILIYDAKNKRTYQHNPQRNATAFLPASTFKILNSLISLETKVITDENTVLTWDGIPRTVPEWNRDLSMKEAIKISAVWFYQILARRIGHARMQKWVTQVGYGNQDIGRKNDIDRFWLEGKLRITPQQQIKFLRRLQQNDLPFSKRSLSIVKNMLVNEQTLDYTLRGKTGLAGLEGGIQPQIGWYVGYLEQNDNTYFFATNIDIRNKKDRANRLELTRRCLQDLALL
jgi:beta-lactamase class D